MFVFTLEYVKLWFRGRLAQIRVRSSRVAVVSLRYLDLLFSDAPRQARSAISVTSGWGKPLEIALATSRSYADSRTL